MCAISGFMGQYDERLLQNMSRIMTHRGPDAHGTFHDQSSHVGLAHRRLSIIDTSMSGNQPMWDATRTCCISFNGEIYNFKELKTELLRDGFTFNNQTDTEVLLNLYLKYNSDMLKLLKGIFAFAIYDSRSKSLLVARDGFGVKPLYYSITPKGFIFASELKALLLEPSVSREVDPDAVIYYVRYLWAPTPHTMLKYVRKLEPGSAIRIKDGAIVEKFNFYNIPSYHVKESKSEEDSAHELRDRLEKAVTRQMVSDVPVGAFLSGGLDSSSICYFASKALVQSKLQCFTIDPGDTVSEGFASDLPYAGSVAKHLGVDLNIIRAEPFHPDQLETMIYHLDEPQPDPAAISVFYISQLARNNGIKVLLSGSGGDDILSGYRQHLAIQLEKYWSWFPQTIRSFLKFLTSNGPKNRPGFRRLEKAFRFAHKNGDERIAGYFHWIDEETEMTICSEWLQESNRKSSFSEPLMNSLMQLEQESTPLTKMLYLDAKHFLIDHNLNYTDKMSMAAGVETRVPFLDPELVDFAASLPDTLKQKGRVGKYIFKKAMEPYLPHDVIYRPKSGFGAPVRKWIKGPLKELVNDVLSHDSIKNRGWFDPIGVLELRQNDEQGKCDAAYSILAMVCLELWARRFLDRSIN